MATGERFSRDNIGSVNPIFSHIRTIIETAFYGNNVKRVDSLKEAYNLAKASPGTVVTDLPVFEPEKIGLEPGAKVLLFNDGMVTGRCAAARRIIGDEGIDEKYYGDILREAIYNLRYRKLYHAQAYIGLDPEFMVKAQLLIPENHENILYNWMLNFQYINDYYENLYRKSKQITGEGNILVLSDPDWTHPDFPYGLALFDPEANTAAILGMRYFGEHKKGTLTLAWSIANRHGYASCHGGLKRYNLEDGRKYVLGVFGLSGSGKSTITHAKHGGKYDITILHDDAFIISTEKGTSIALEPSYFDKTQDYPTNSPDNKYLITVQNCGATLDEDGNIVLVTEDIRNGNGRAIKSKLWAENRVDRFDEPINGIIWLMKDPALPPVVKINDPVLASVMGATLATKRTTAERLVKGVNRDALVIEPYANPFRTYPLIKDYEKFYELFVKDNVDCYIVNTGHFLNKKIPKEVTLSIIEGIVEGYGEFKKWGDIPNLEIMEIKGFIPDLADKDYLNALFSSIKDRINFLISRKDVNGGKDVLPEVALNSLYTLLRCLDKGSTAKQVLKRAL